MNNANILVQNPELMMVAGMEKKTVIIGSVFFNSVKTKNAFNSLLKALKCFKKALLYVELKDSADIFKEKIS